MIGLATRKSVSTTLLLNAEASLSAAKERHITALIAVEEAESRLGQLANERAKLENDSKLALSQEIIKVHQEIDEAEVALKSSASSLDAMRAATISGDDKENDGVIFDVVRKSRSQTLVHSVPGTFELEPGDLVRVRIPKPRSAVNAAPAASQ